MKAPALYQICSSMIQAVTLLKHDFQKALAGCDNGLDRITSIGRTYVRFAVENFEYYQALTAIQAHCGLGPFQAGETATDLDLQYVDDVRRLLEIIEEIHVMMENQITRGITDGSIRADVGQPKIVALSLRAQTSGLIEFADLQEKTLLADNQIGKMEFIEQGILLMRQSLMKL